VLCRERFDIISEYHEGDVSLHQVVHLWHGGSRQVEYWTDVNRDSMTHACEVIYQIGDWHTHLSNGGEVHGDLGNTRAVSLRSQRVHVDISVCKCTWVYDNWESDRLQSILLKWGE
jgi:hypothetical protein